MMPSLFEEQITLATSGTIRHRDPFDPQMSAPSESFPAAEDYAFQPDEYANHIRRLKARRRHSGDCFTERRDRGGVAPACRKASRCGRGRPRAEHVQVVTSLDAAGMAIESSLRDVVIEMKRFRASRLRSS